MGGKLTKSKKSNEESTKSVPTNEKSKKLDKKKKSSSSTMIDQGTNTENLILPESTFNEQLVGDTNKTQLNNDVVENQEECQQNSSIDNSNQIINDEQQQNAES